ncbi:MAG: sigma-54 dependent transcriptional regulator [Gemmatimonadota bacterium]|nr:sigma-54 dependent transcriptional regulator [Gemmatimonadota bacterium]
MRILVVDDDPGLRRSLGLLLEGDGHTVAAVSRASEALTRLAGEAFDVVLCDVRMPEMDGLEFLRRYRDTGGTALVIMMSAYGGEDAAIAAMKDGAYDYLPKPFRPDEVLLTLRKAEERERLRGRVAALEAEVARFREGEIVAESAAMRHVLDLATRVAPHPTTVLVTGESGTGKEVVARAVHRMSPRREAPFVAINCAAIPEALLESELFGHVRGAFTGAVGDKTGLFEEASGGTLLLDEIGDLPAPLQVKLLRVLQEGAIRRVGETRERRVDVRVLAATARDLEREVTEGRFREDLYYRLNVVRIHIPPLRERPDDLERLALVLLARSGARANRRVRFAADALAALRARSWPGNVRELENAVERAVVLSADEVIDRHAFEHQAGPRSPRPDAAADAGLGEPVPLKDAVAATERAAIQQALAAADGNRQEAARRLGVSLRTLYYKLRDLGLG